MESSAGEETRLAPLPVQELASNVVVVPARYVVARAAKDDAEAAAAVPAPVPVIDLGRLCHHHPPGGESADEAAKLRAALQSWGLFLVTNHGVEASLMDLMMEASREFFRQPLEEKQRN